MSEVRELIGFLDRQIKKWEKHIIWYKNKYHPITSKYCWRIEDDITKFKAIKERLSNENETDELVETLMDIENASRLKIPTIVDDAGLVNIAKIRQILKEDL